MYVFVTAALVKLLVQCNTDVTLTLRIMIIIIIFICILLQDILVAAERTIKIIEKVACEEVRGAVSYIFTENPVDPCRCH
jgi:hypothetical protein